MVLDLKDKKVVLIGGRNSVGQAIAEAVARQGADVVIWLRKWSDELNQPEVLPVTQVELPSKQLNGTSPHMSLWRQTMAQKSYW